MLLLRRFELKPVELGAEQRSGLWQEAVKRVAGSQEAASKRVRDAAVIRLTVDVSLSLTVLSLREHGRALNLEVVNLN